jgi:manganese efflux pump family protein
MPGLLLAGRVPILYTAYTRKQARYREMVLDLFTILLIAVGLSMDAMAVSLGIGTTQYANSPRPIFRLSFHFGLFQFLMPVLGWLGGISIQQFISGFDHWIAFGLLAFVGVRMIRSGLDTEGESHTSDPSRGGMLVLLAVATSIDALAVGLSLAMLKVSILYPSLVIGVITGTLSLIGLRVGGRLGQTFGKRIEIIGGLILIAIGLRVLITHLTGAA